MRDLPSDYPSVMTLLSPLAHSERTVGIDSKFRRVGMVVSGGVEMVPVLSGNAIRGLLRRASGRDLLERVGVERGTLAPAWIYLLSSGGTLSKGETRKAFDPSYVRELRRLIPPLGLFGGSLQGGILPGSVDVDMALPIVSETEPYTGHAATMRLSELLEEIPYSRRDDLEEREASDESKVQMRYSVECLRAGVTLAHGLVLRTQDPVLRGCLWRSIERVSASRMGGKGATGHGRFMWTWEPQQEAIDAYAKHVEEHAQRIRDLLLGVV
jgi:hypothetical protein